MGSRIIVVKNNGRIITGLFNENDLVEVQVDVDPENRLLGNIYLGKVKNIVKNINAAFVEIEDKKICYLSLSDVVNPVFANNDHPGKIRVGDELIVQVSKENSRYKAPVCSADFNLTGKYLVLVHGKAMLGVSSKIKDPARRARLKELIKPYITDDYGFIVRTNAENADDRVLEQEMGRLAADYRSIVEFGVHWTCFSKLYTTPPSYLWEIRDGYSDEIEEIKTDDRELYDQMKEYIGTYQPEDMEKLKLYKDDQLSLTKLYSLEEKLERALHERIWLDSGAFLIIQPTEALTVIDVNTGKAIKSKGDQEETFFKVNVEAATEIARQLRLRNISGIIIVDFIDMSSEEHKKELMRCFSAVLEKDHIPTRLVDMTALNLVEITRKKIRRSLYEQMAGDAKTED